MLNFIRQITATAALTLACSAGAEMQSIDITDIVEQVAPMQAYTVDAGDYTAVVFHTELGNGQYNVVTTIGPNIGTDGSITQHSIEMSPGQQYTLRVDSASEKDVAFSFNAESDSLNISSL